MRRLPSPAASAASAGGAVLAGAVRALGVVRPEAKPLHPYGDLVTARVTRTGGVEPTGVPWLDQPGEDDVIVRASRAVGLPSPLPDVHGLAVRVPVGTAHADLLLASTGLGQLSRFVLTVGRTPAARPLTTLLPYRSPTGPVLLAARPAGPTVYDLAWGRPTGGWVGFGRLTLGDPHGPDPLVSFDPLLHTLPGLENYGWVRRLREPAYATARSHR